jgi:hypothetical protein
MSGNPPLRYKRYFHRLESQAPVPNARYVAAPGAISERSGKRAELGGELGTGEEEGTTCKAERGYQGK